MVFSIAFENAVEQAIAKVFLQEIEVTRRASKELATGPSVNFTTEPPHELKTITSLTPKTGQHFIGDAPRPPRPSPFPSPRGACARGCCTAEAQPCSRQASSPSPSPSATSRGRASSRRRWG